MATEYGRADAGDDERSPINALTRKRPISAPSQQTMVPCDEFYRTYHGHRAEYVEQVLKSLREAHGESSIAIYLAGDSSLDNKTWLFNQGARVQYWRPASAHAPAVNGYEYVLQPPRMVCDVAYWMNKILDDHAANAFAVNTAIEATTLASRVGGVQCCFVPTCGGLYEQDEFIRDHLRPTDMLVISVGGNDVAMMPSIFTVIALILLMLTPWVLLIDWHPSVLYFTFIFKQQVQWYAERLTRKARPSKIAACMIYNLDEHNGPSWATPALLAMCYCCAPGILQRRLRLAFERGTALVQVPGATVVPVALADALDGKTSEDYHQRVEPSVIGGQKMARLILHRLGWPVQTPGYRYERHIRPGDRQDT